MASASYQLTRTKCSDCDRRVNVGSGHSLCCVCRGKAKRAPSNRIPCPKCGDLMNPAVSRSECFDCRERALKLQSRYRAAHRRRHPQRNKARVAVLAAIKAGKLIRPSTCSRCGDENQIHAHHESYEPDRWLDLVWLCRPCHMARHAELRKECAQ